MSKSLLTTIAIAAALISLPMLAMSFSSGDASRAACACCGEGCTCVDCGCDEKSCACDSGGQCACSEQCEAECCGSAKCCDEG
jgi:hypothetical protein